MAGRVSTDNTRVNGRIVGVAPQVSGQVVRLSVAENQRVDAGQSLLDLVEREFEHHMSERRAELRLAAWPLKTCRWTRWP